LELVNYDCNRKLSGVKLRKLRLTKTDSYEMFALSSSARMLSGTVQCPWYFLDAHAA
jgi:hypothetical protein